MIISRESSVKALPIIRINRIKTCSQWQYFISQGIKIERLEYNGYGSDRPIAPNNTEEGRTTNRRVEIEVK